MHGEQLAARRGGGGGDSASGAPATAAASAASGHASPLRRFLSGALSGTLSNALLQPFDVVRSVQQAQLLSAPRDGGALATARRLVASEGWPALWKGLAPAILRVFFGAGIYFVALDAIQRRLAAATTATAAPPHAVAPSNDPAAAAVAAAIASAAAAESSRLSAASPPTAWSAGARDFVAGACARTFAATVMLPVAVVKTRMELAPRGTAHFRTPFHGMAHLARSEGAGALFRGLLPTVARDAPFSGLYLACYTAVLRRCVERSKEQCPDWVRAVIARAEPARASSTTSARSLSLSPPSPRRAADSTTQPTPTARQAARAVAQQWRRSAAASSRPRRCGCATLARRSWRAPRRAS